MRMTKELLFFSSLVVICVLIFVVQHGFKNRPFFTSSLLVCMVVFVAFIFTENMPQFFLHNASEFENRFWTIIAGMVAFVLLFVSDSPFWFVSDRFPMVAFFLIFLSAFFAHSYNRHKQKRAREMARLQEIEEATGMRNNEVEQLTPEIQKMIHIINEQQKIVDPKFLGGGVKAFFESFFGIKENPLYSAEEKIIQTLKDDCNTPQILNTIIKAIDISSIIYKVKDRGGSRDNRTKLLKLLCEDRLVDLNPHSKFKLLSALQELKLTAHRHAEKYVKNIICSCTNEKDSTQLTDLKLMIDSRLSINTMHKLLYLDMGYNEESRAVRKSILAHFKKQAALKSARARLGLNGKSKNPLRLAWTKIVSDIDDTLYSSGGSFPAGCDTSFPDHCVYPGVLAFYRELDLGKNGENEWPADKKDKKKEKLGNLVFMSARPHVYDDLTEAPLFDKINRGFGSDKKVHCNPPVLAGEIFSGLNLIFRDNAGEVAKKKYKNYCEYASIYPEYTFIFIGDNGQGDVRCAEMILNPPPQPTADSPHPYPWLNENFTTDEIEHIKNSLSRVYIHHVQDPKKTLCTSNKLQKPENGKISDGKIIYFKTYIEAAIDAFQNNLIKNTGLRRVMCEAARDLLEVPDAKWAYQTPVWDKHNKDEEKKNKSPRIAQSSLDVVTEILKESQYRLHNEDLLKGNEILMREGLEPVPLLLYAQRLPTGTPVVSIMGVGVVTRFDRNKNMYEVVHKGRHNQQCNARPLARVYCHSSSLVVAPQPKSSWTHTRPHIDNAFDKAPILPKVGKGTEKMPDSVAFTDKTSLPVGYPGTVKVSCWTLMRRCKGFRTPLTLPERFSHADLASVICLELPKEKTKGLIIPNEVNEDRIKTMQDVRGCIVWTKMGEAILLDQIFGKRLKSKDQSPDLVVVYFLGFQSIGFLQREQVVLLTTNQSIEWKLHINLFLLENASTPNSTPSQTPSLSPLLRMSTNLSVNAASGLSVSKPSPMVLTPTNNTSNASNSGCSNICDSASSSSSSSSSGGVGSSGVGTNSGETLADSSSLLLDEGLRRRSIVGDKGRNDSIKRSSSVFDAKDGDILPPLITPGGS